MRHIFWFASIILMLVPALGPARADAPAGGWQWARSLGGANADRASGMAMDRSGNVYVTGTFEKTIRIGLVTLNSGQYTGLFVAKYDPTGVLQWATAATGSGDYRQPSIAVDSLGNSYIVGSFSQTATFGLTTLTAEGTHDAFIAKCNAGGTFVWANRAGGSRADFGMGVAADSLGNCYMTGSYREQALFGTIDITSAGGYDAFVAKYNGAGTIQWVKSYGGPIDDNGFDVAVDAGSNVYVTGDFSGDAYFGPVLLRSAGAGAGSDLFVTKSNVNGDIIMAVRAGGENSDHAYAIAVHEPSGNIYVTGSFIGEAEFGGTTLSGAGQVDMFVAQFDNSGTFRWVQSGGGEGQDAGFDLAIDLAGNCYVTGKYEGEFTVAKFGDSILSERGLGDVFAAAFDAGGKYIWVRSCGTTNFDEGVAIVANYRANANLDAFVAGNYSGNLLFDSGLSLGEIGLVDAFLAKVGGRSPVVDTSITTQVFPLEIFCSGTTLSVNFTASGPFTDSNVFTAQLSDASGSFASPIVLDTLKSSTSGTIIVRVPTVPAGTRYRIRVVSSSPAVIGSDNGADLRFSGPVNPTVTASGPLTFCQGDSVVLDAGAGYGYYEWTNDNADTTRTLVVRESGVYRIYTRTLDGCLGFSDSVVVQVNPLPQKPTVTQTGGALQSSPADSYQWLYEGAEIAGATGPTHTPARNGRYAVMIRNASGCTATSDAVVVNTTSVKQEEMRREIAVYPQPTLGEFTLEVNLRQGSQVRLSIRDISGREVFNTLERSAAASYRRTVDLRGEAPGVYFIQVQSDGRRWTREVVKR